MLQQNLYNENNRYIKWIMKNFSNVFVTFALKNRHNSTSCIICFSLNY